MNITRALYEIGQIPPTGNVPREMYAQLIRADCFGELGKAFRVERVPVPEIRPDEALVSVMAAGINYNVTAFDLGGRDSSGVACQVGSEVESLEVDDEVVVHCGTWDRNDPGVKAGHDPTLAPIFQIRSYEANWGSLAQRTKLHAKHCSPAGQDHGDRCSDARERCEGSYDGTAISPPEAQRGGSEARVQRSTIRGNGRARRARRHAFVAMSLRSDLDDLYRYGIEGAARTAGFHCERADLSSFTGDVLGWICERIRTSAIVIAELTDANPNVYLEVGYAWAKGIPTILLVQESASRLRFDVRGQRCIVYDGSINHLERLLRRELHALALRHPQTSEPGASA